MAGNTGEPRKVASCGKPSSCAISFDSRVSGDNSEQLEYKNANTRVKESSMWMGAVGG
jgi:hypothetical protein